MASSPSAQISLNIAWACNDTSNVLAPRNVAGNYPANGSPLKIKLGSGSTSGNIDALYVGQVTVPASSTATLALTSLVDPSGDTVDFARVIGFLFYNNDTASKITLGAGTHPLGAVVGTSTDTLDLNPQFPVLFGKNDATGYAVTSGSADTLTFTNGASNSIIVDVMLLGRKE